MFIDEKNRYAIHIPLGTRRDWAQDRSWLHAPEMVFDLPANGRRFIQRVDGYRYTIVNGTVSYENSEPTGAMPGKMIRGPQPEPAR